MNDLDRASSKQAARAGEAPSGPARLLRFVVAWIDRAASTLDPGYFALVMATGIVSNAFFLERQRALADALFAVNLAAYAWLWLLTIVRAVRAGRAMGADLVSPRRVFLFFTTVAATDVLGTAIALRGYSAIALAMWCLALVLWAALIYLGFGVLILRNRTGRADVVEGAWLNAIVGTQSLVILGAILAAPAATPQAFILLQMLWTIGLALYAILIVLLSYRIFFLALEPGEVAPPLWVVMGAAAISVNAGALLVAGGGGTPFLRALPPFLDAVTLALWAWATWWIPLLLLLGIWKHGVHRVPIDYTPMLWSIVFPLGMYAVATLRLSQLADFTVLGSWSRVMAWIALAAWCTTATGLVAASWRRARRLAALAGHYPFTSARP